MSVTMMARVWAESGQEEGTLLVHLALADFADDTGSCWPSIETLARKSRLSDRQAQRAISRLVAAGELAVDRQTGPHQTNRYRLLFGGDILSPRQNDGVTFGAVRGDTHVTPRGDIWDARGDTHVTRSVSRSVSRSINDPYPPTPQGGKALEKQNLTRRRQRASTGIMTQEDARDPAILAKWGLTLADVEE